MKTRTNFLFLSCLYSENQKQLFQDKSKRGYQFAAQNLQESIIEGFLANNVNFKVLTIPSLSTFPMGCKLSYINDTDFIFYGKKLGKSVGYVNLPIIRNLQPKRCYSLINDWYYRNSSENNWIVVYGLHVHLLNIAINSKKKNPDLKICVIIPDLPEFMGCNKYLKAIGWQKRNIEQVHRLVQQFDAYIPLAAPMMENLAITQKPFTVMEGIFSGVKENTSVEKEPYKVILYTGNLNKRYGILNLLDAFQNIENAEDYRLWLRGNGDAKEEVLRRADSDSRIKYIEQMSKAELIKLQKRATLLVNCVTPSMPFTRYFFPSKTMDYLASGTPTVMYKLDCLPDEYKSHLYFFSDESIEAMADSFKMICEKSHNELSSFGKEASLFIYNEKNSEKQTRKIIKFLESL